MTPGTDIRLQQQLTGWSGIFVITVLLISLLVLSGWQFDIEIFKRPLPHLVAMNPLTALLFLFSCLAIAGSAKRSKHTGPGILAVLIIITCLLRLLALTGLPLNIDQWLYANKLSEDLDGNISNRMAPNTALAFIFTGLSVLLLNSKQYKKQVWAHYFAWVICIFGLFSIIGYSYQVKEYRGILAYIPMAIHTGVCFVLIALAILISRPGKGLIKELTGPHSGSISIRRLLPAAYLLPFLLGYISQAGFRAGVFSAEFGVSFFVLSIIIIFQLIIWYNAKLLNKRDAKNKDVQDALYASEIQVQTIFSAAPDAVVVTDEEGKIIKWNAKAETLFGWTAGEITGKLLNETIIPVQHRQAHEKGMAHYLKTGEGHILNKTIETEAVTKDNFSFAVSLSISPAIVNGRHIFIGFIRDITDRKKAEEKFRSLLESAPDAIVIAGEDGLIQLVNAQTEKMFGYKREEILGQKIEMLMPERYRPGHTGHRTGYFTNPKTRGMGEGLELFGRKKDGTEFFVEISLSPLETEEGLLVSASIRDISDRKKAEEKFRSLLESAPDAIIIAGENGIIQLVNAQTEIMFGYNRREIIGQNIEMLMPERYRAGHQGYRTGYFSSPKTRGMGEGLELFGLKKDGTEFFIEISLSPLETEEGLLVSASIRDISDRKKAEEKFRGLLESAPDAIVITGEDGIIQLVNAQTEKMFGYKREEITGRKIEMLMPERYRGSHHHHRTGYFINPKTRGMGEGRELYGRKKDGTEFFVEISLSPLETAEGLLVSAAIRDITERKKLEEQLKQFNTELTRQVKMKTAELSQSEKIYKTIASGIPGSMICVFDSEHRYRLVEGDLVPRFGFIKEHVVGERAPDILSPDSYAVIRPRLDRVFNGEQFTIENENNGFDTLTRFVPVKDENNRVAMAMLVVLDITELKNAQRDLAILNRDLERKVDERTGQLAIVNKELEAFTYSVSHDLRAPLRIIDGFANILAEDYTDKLDEEGNKSLGIIKTNALRMGQLIDDLLNLSRYGRKEIVLTQVNMQKLVQSTFEELQLINNWGITINCEKILPARCDSNLLRQVWSNLLSNAIKYSSKTTNPEINIGSYKKENEIIYFVKDNGCGFDMKYAGKLFGVFQRLHKPTEFEGTGVGLALVQRIITKHGGKVWADAQVNKGATFYFSLPGNKSGIPVKETIKTS